MIYTLKLFDTPLLRFEVLENLAEPVVHILELDEEKKHLLPLDMEPNENGLVRWMLDYALRRRFAFFDMKPAFNSEGFRAYRTELNSLKLDRLIACVESLNNAISADESLGEGFCIGHSYF